MPPKTPGLFPTVRGGSFWYTKPARSNRYPALKTLPQKTPPLEGLLVVALEQAVAAPLCTARLREAGARVIKIERESGDFARHYDTAANGESSYFTWTNQGKESIVLNIKDASDQALLRRILAKADVLVQNLAPGALKKLSLDGSTLQLENPRLITCNISGYGESEAVGHLKAYDLLVQSESGLVSISGGPGEPGRIGISLCDIGAGVTAHAAILEALIARSLTGQGRVIDISLFDVAAEWMTVPYIHTAYGDGAPTRQGLLHPSIAPYGAYRTSDDIDTLVSIQNEREWLSFCDHVLEDREIASSGQFSTNAARVENRPALDNAILAIIGPLTADQFRERLKKGQIAFGAVNTVDDLLTHAALRKTTHYNSANQPVELPAHPFSDASNTVAVRSPKIGEHTDAVKSEFAEAT